MIIHRPYDAIPRMKFVDEATITVQAGKGGDGCVSFRRERCLPHGGPNGGDGGDGGSVYLVGDEGLNTLADFRHSPVFKATNGASGQGSDRNGKQGGDLFVRVPTGTAVYYQQTGECIGDILGHQKQLLVAVGGRHGLGNTRFKSSTNRAPRQFTRGEAGESRALYLELKVLADVGLLGLPNAGKSTLLSVVSSARPRIADYPFTTLYPILGVVRAASYRSFVMADIPGLIEGASAGAGLGIQFLRHLRRTRLLLHLLDIGAVESVAAAAHNIRSIEKEISGFDSELGTKERWLVCTKTDSMTEEEVKHFRQALLETTATDQPCFTISAVSGKGLAELINAISERLTQMDDGQQD